MIRRRIGLIILAIATALMIWAPQANQQPSLAQSPDSTNNTLDSSPCFYRSADGAVVDLQGICGQSSAAPGITPSRPHSITPNLNGANPVSTNPAMQITDPNDPGVLYLSNSGGTDQGAIAASAAEQ